MRSVWVRAALGLFAATLLLSAGLRVARVWAEGQFARELGSLDPSAYTRPAVKTDNNAARYFLAAAGKLRVEPEEAKLLASWASAPQNPVPDRLSALVSNNEPALLLARRGAGLFESFYGIDYSAGFHATLPDLPKLTTLGRLLGLSARLARERGECSRSVSSLAALASLAASLESEPGLTFFYAGLSLERLQLGELAQLLGEAPHLRCRWASFSGVFSPVSPEAVFPKMVGLEEASLRRELPERTGLTSLWATDFLRFRAAQKARKIAALPSRPCAQWARRTAWEELPNHESRLLLALAQGQGVKASRVLMEAATLCLRHQAEHRSLPASLGVFPEASRANPFTGQPISYEVGTGTLSVPEADALWSVLRLPTPPPPFTVRLPLDPEKPSHRSPE